MLECLIIGDSIALGIAQAKTECVAIVRSGISTRKWYNQFHQNPAYSEKSYKVAVISLSSNDMVGGYTSEYLYDVRKDIKAQTVIWILPSYTLKPKQFQMVKEIANEFKDGVLDITAHIGADGLHPPNLNEYRKIGDKLKQLTPK